MAVSTVSFWFAFARESFLNLVVAWAIDLLLKTAVSSMTRLPYFAFFKRATKSVTPNYSYASPRTKKLAVIQPHPLVLLFVVA